MSQSERINSKPDQLNQRIKEKDIPEVWKIISLNTSFLKETIFKVLDNSNFQVDSERIFEFFQGTKTTKVLSKKEEFKIISLIKQLERDSKTESENFVRKIILLESDFLVFSNYQEFIGTLKRNFDFEIEIFSSLEQSRQSFCGLQNILSDYSSSGQAKALFISIESEKTIVTIGTLSAREQSVTLGIGKKQVIRYITHLVKENKVAYLPTFIKAGLQKFVQEIRVIGKPSLVCFDEESINLLEKIFCGSDQTSQNNKPTQKTKRLDTDSIYQFCNRLISSNFRPNKDTSLSSSNSESINSNEELYRNSSHLVLIGFLLQLLEIKTCLLNKQARTTGYLKTALEKNKNLPLEDFYQTDWFFSAQELALKFAPERTSQASQNAILACKIFGSATGILHNWGFLEKKYLWLSCFLFESVFQVFPKITKEIIFESLEDISQIESEIIYSIILLVDLDRLSSRVDILSKLPVKNREFVSKISYLIEMARAFNTTGRSAVKDLKIENPKNNNQEIVLKVTSRLDLSPELIQVGLLKSSFEAQFKRIKIELEK